MAKLTAMVSVYNSSAWLRNRIENLLNTTLYKKNELIIYLANASSPDQEDDVIALEYSQFNNVKYETIPFCTVYSAWNHIIQNVDSTYLTNANTDDIVSPDMYERLTDVLDVSKCGFAYPSWHTTNVANQKWELLMDYDVAGIPGNYCGDIEKSGVGHFPIWKRDLHNQHGLFDDRFKVLGDADWWARCHYLGNVKFQWINEFLACYLWRDGQDGKSRNLWHEAISSDEWDLYHRKIGQYKEKING